MRNLITMIILSALCLSATTGCGAGNPKKLKKFFPGKIWPDNKGVHINAHGGGIIFHEGVYYWFGEHKVKGVKGNEAHVGVHCYSSTDLYNWKDEGIALEVSKDPESDITQGCVLERPKVIYNKKTNKFVMWFHLELIGSMYETALSGTAVSDKVTGPYTFLRSFRPNAGYWPINVTEEQKQPVDEITKTVKLRNDENPETPKYNILGRDFAGGQMARDMTLFVDDDGKAYHIYSSEVNSTLHISLLTDDYLQPAGEYVRVFLHRWMEAPAVCKRNGKYYLIASGCTGWAPNAARSAVADSIWGPWKELGNPCIGVNPENNLGSEKTFGCQSTFILLVQGKDDAYIVMFDKWDPKDAINGRYVWLPMEFTNEGFEIVWRNDWDLSAFDCF